MRHRGFAGVLLLLILLLGAKDGSQPAPPPADVTKIEKIEPHAGWRCLERGLPDQARWYSLLLDAGQYVHLEVEQRGLDVAIQLFDPARQPQLEVDSPTGARDTEDLFFLARTTGRHLLEIRSAPGIMALGSYEIRVEAARPATDKDRRFAAAADAYSRARRLDKEAPSLAEAAVHYREAARLWRGLGERRGEARSLWDLGKLILRDAKRPADALQVLPRALQLYRQRGDVSSQAHVLADLGSARKRSGDFDGAAAAFGQAIALFQGLNEPDKLDQLAVLWNNLATVRVRQERWDDAIDLYAQAIRELERQGEWSQLAITRTNLGILYSFLRESRKAAQQYQLTLPLLLGPAHELQRAKTRSKLADELLGLEGPPAALRLYRKVLFVRRRLGDIRGEGVTQSGIGLAQLAANRPQEALRALGEAVRIFEERGAAEDRAIAWQNLAYAYERLGSWDRAGTLYQRALSWARAGSLHRTEEEIGLALARLARKQGRLAEAERALNEIEGSSRESLVEASRSLRIDILIEQDLREPGLGYDAQAFAWSERSRSRGFLASRRPAPRDRQPLEDLSREINARDLSPEEGSGAPGEDYLETLLNRFGQGREDRIRNPEPSPLSLEQVQRQLLTDDTLLLEYSLGEERSFLWALSGTSSRSIADLPGRAILEAAARDLRSRLPSSHYESEAGSFQRTADKLSRMLLGPVADLLHGQRLIVVAPGILQSVPFAALSRPQGKGPASPLAPHPLLVDHEIVSLPSASVLAVLRGRRRNRRPASGQLAVVADPVTEASDERLPPPRRPAEPESDFPRLPYAGQEATYILALAGRRPVQSALGLAANRELALSGQLGDYGILHFATHGRYNDRIPQLSSLVLSLYDEAGHPIDGQLRAYEIFDLRLRAELVVLSACQTAGDGNYGGAGRAGLAQAFLHAGASSVVVSVGNVDDRATAELMKYFYDALLRLELPPAAALRQAQLQLRQDPQWQAPYFWAGFVIIGDWQ